MSRKDYVAIAEALNSASATQEVIYSVGRVLLADNPRFDWSRFIKACGINE
jgi:hypothetical protein